MEKLIHLLLPRQSNNQRAKILQIDSLFVLIALFVLAQFSFELISKYKPGILGYASQISPNDIIAITNTKRSEVGLQPLTYNENLSSAAYTKARDMIDRDYWAHVAPDGTQPWSFITRFGYKYRYAGENLARDFSSAQSIVDAWMGSPTHRDNILNPKYKEIGIGVTEGDLAGVDSTIVVQFFGTRYADTVVENVAQVPATQTIATNKPIATQIPTATSEPLEIPLPVISEVQAVVTTPEGYEPMVLVSPFNTTRSISVTVLALLILVFLIDSYLVTKRKISRVVGRTFAHVTFLLMILMIVLIIRSGSIL